MNDKTIFDHIVQTSADIASIKTTIDDVVKPLAVRVEDHETRIGATEGDVKTGKKVFGGLFSAMLVFMAVIGSWVKGLF